MINKDTLEAGVSNEGNIPNRDGLCSSKPF